jgi:uncharacterized membrane protein YhaH (DUF805 family)
VILASLVLVAGNFAVIALGRVGGLVFAAFLPILAINLAAALRRLHDRNKGVGWLLLFQFGPLASGGVAQLLAASASAAAQLAAALVALGSLGLSLWSLIEIGFLRGSSTPNRFGDPVTV